MMMHFVGMVPGGEAQVRDLSLRVDEGEVVSVLADKALTSVDLWRAVNQKLLYQLRRGPLLDAAVVVSDQARIDTLERDKADLQAQVEGMVAQLAALREQVEERTAEVRVLTQLLTQAPVAAQAAPVVDPRFDQMMAKLDELARRPAVVQVAGQSALPATPAASDEGVPLFLPTFDKPTEGQIHVKEETSEGSLTSARDRLRELKGKR